MFHICSWFRAPSRVIPVLNYNLLVSTYTDRWYFILRIFFLGFCWDLSFKFFGHDSIILQQMSFIFILVWKVNVGIKSGTYLTGFTYCFSSTKILRYIQIPFFSKVHFIRKHKWRSYRTTCIYVANDYIGTYYGLVISQCIKAIRLRCVVYNPMRYWDQCI